MPMYEVSVIVKRQVRAPSEAVARSLFPGQQITNVAELQQIVSQLEARGAVVKADSSPGWFSVAIDGSVERQFYNPADPSLLATFVDILSMERLLAMVLR